MFADNSRSCFSILVTRASSDPHPLVALTGHRFPRFLCAAPLRAATWGLCRLVFAFFSIHNFHAVRSATVSPSSLAARRICVCSIFPQPPGIGSKLSFFKCSRLYPGCNRDCRQTKRANVGSGQPKNTHPFKRCDYLDLIVLNSLRSLAINIDSLFVPLRHSNFCRLVGYVVVEHDQETAVR